MQRMFNVAKWARIGEGEVLDFNGNRPRVVRLEVNAPSPSRLYLYDRDEGGGIFLAKVDGRDSVEFHAGGKFSLMADAECYVYTADGQHIHHEAIDPVIFTRITERRQIPAEIAHMQQMMQINIERRLAAQRSEFNDLLRSMQADRVAAARAARERPSQPPAASASEPASASGANGADARPAAPPAGGAAGQGG